MSAREWLKKAQKENFAIGALRPFDKTQGLRLRSGHAIARDMEDNQLWIPERGFQGHKQKVGQ